jgi:hypothetical protein
VFPQLRMMQNSKVVERFTAHYVFCLGLSRFFSCAHWVLQVGTPGHACLRVSAGVCVWVGDVCVCVCVCVRVRTCERERECVCMAAVRDQHERRDRAGALLHRGTAACA